ncbi:MAG: pyridoxal phosphate-dependent aminotransferase [Lachnospiraceae bacterium]|nr:pyridoxal phosphate-dependent aminotransferase [Lachnospiraceae bacterium]
MYDFDELVDRRDSYSLKWDVAKQELPMWVADMDFKTAPEIRAAIEKRAIHGVFGYTVIPDAWQEAYMHWWKDRHGLEIRKEWLVYSSGVIPAISSAVRKLTTPGENVLIQTPVYNTFFNSIRNNGRNVLECPLKYKDYIYTIDFDRLERDLADPQTSMMILCNPHNPVGKIWDRDTLARIGDLCAKYHVLVISDEIHCDLLAPGMKYVPFAGVSENCRNHSISLVAPTKTFNLAGLQTAAAIVPNPLLRHRLWRGINTDEVGEPNAFAIDATIAAFHEGGSWLDALRNYLQENKDYVCRFLDSELKQMRVVSTDATYLLWLDCERLAGSVSRFVDYLRESTGLYIMDGKEYGQVGTGFLRINVACPRSLVQDGMERLKTAVLRYDIISR